MKLFKASLTWLNIILVIQILLDSARGHPRVKKNIRSGFYTVFGKSIKLEANSLIKKQVQGECKKCYFRFRLTLN